MIKYNLFNKLPYKFSMVTPNQTNIPEYIKYDKELHKDIKEYELFSEQEIETINFICNKLNCDFKRYYEIYTEFDAVILFDIMNKFERTCLRTFDSNPFDKITISSYAFALANSKSVDKIQPIFNYYKDPVLSQMVSELYKLKNRDFKALLKSEVDRYEGDKTIVDNMDLYKFFDIKGGICFVNQSEVEEGPNTLIRSFDLNAMYVSIMSGVCPTSVIGFEDVKDVQFYLDNGKQFFDSYVVSILKKKHIYGMENYPEFIYELEVDIEPNTNLPLPILAENKLINEADLSEFQKELYRSEYSTEKNNMEYMPQEKLVLDFKTKYNYKIPSYYLYFAVLMGYKVLKIHKVAKLKVGKPLTIFLQMLYNERLKLKESDPTLAEIYKLIGNSIYGSFITNQENYTEFKILTPEYMDRELKKKEYLNIIYEDDETNKIAINVNNEVTLTKPRYFGSHVLNFTKMHYFYIFYKMYEVFEKKVSLIYQDTDSYYLKFDCNQEYYDEKIKIFQDKYNFIGKEIGKMKQEYGQIHNFVGLRAKSYAINYTENGKFDTKRRCKGGEGYKFNMDTYKNTLNIEQDENGIKLFDKSKRTETQYPIKSEDFEMKRFKTERLLLSAFDDKMKLDFVNGKITRSFYR